MLRRLFSVFRDNTETRSSGAGYTAEIMGARAAFVAGRSGLGELTSTAQGCVSLWESGLALADVEGTTALPRQCMAIVGRSLALRGESVFVIGDQRLFPAVDWEVGTRDGEPRAYRVNIPEAGGGRSETRLAAEVLHFRIGVDAAAPWFGQAPLKRSALSASMLHAVETALAEAFENMPLGSQIVPMPETPDQDMGALGRGFRGQRGRVLLRESVQVTAAGGPAPAQDWRPSDVSPDLSRSMTRETLIAARQGICAAFGILPGLFNDATTGPMVREAQRHLATWTLQPIAGLIAEEASNKLATDIKIDVLRPSQAWDAGGRARAVAGLIQALALAKEAGIDEATALKLVDWEE